MEELIFNIKNDDFKELNKNYAKTKGSSVIGKRAIEIVKLYFIQTSDKVKIEQVKKGPDLKITRLNKEPLLIEVKGTSDDGIFNRLYVSGEPSHKALNDGIPLYRVINVFSKKPKIYILKHDSDFLFSKVQEPRWKLRRKN